MEKYACGCSVQFDAAGKVRAVTVCKDHDHLFSEDKSFKQMSLDIHHCQLQLKHAPKPEAASK